MAGGNTPRAAPGTAVQRAMDMVPRILSSKPHVAGLGCLLLYLVVLPLLHVYTPSANVMLIGGNYTNVTSDLGACIAAGGTVTLLRHSHRRNRLAEASHRIVADLYRHHTGTDHPDVITAAGTPPATATEGPGPAR